KDGRTEVSLRPPPGGDDQPSERQIVEDVLRRRRCWRGSRRLRRSLWLGWRSRWRRRRRVRLRPGLPLARVHHVRVELLDRREDRRQRGGERSKRVRPLGQADPHVTEATLGPVRQHRADREPSVALRVALYVSAERGNDLEIAGDR